MDSNRAYLSNDRDMIKFCYGDSVVRFREPYSLEYFTDIKDWDNGYLVVMAKYQHSAEPEEDYIDMVPILTNLYIDAPKFLQSIKEVSLDYGQN